MRDKLPLGVAFQGVLALEFERLYNELGNERLLLVGGPSETSLKPDRLSS